MTQAIIIILPVELFLKFKKGTSFNMLSFASDKIIFHQKKTAEMSKKSTEYVLIVTQNNAQN